MGTANTFRTDLYSIHNVIQNTLVTHPKEIFIESLREFFSQDAYYHYVSDQWGFPLTPDHTGLPNDAGVDDDLTTRILISEPYRMDVIYYPSLLVRSAGSRFKPISFNNEEGSVQHTATRFVDGYGNESIVIVPSHFIKAGAWEGSINIDIETKSPRSRDDLVDLVSLHFVSLRREQLTRAGVFVKIATVGSPSESDDRTHGKIFKQTVTCEIRSEWRRQIPITNVVDAINICVDFGNLDTTPATIAPNLRVSTTIELVDALSDL